MQNYLTLLNAINPVNSLEEAIKQDLITNCPECHDEDPSTGDAILSHIECTYHFIPTPEDKAVAPDELNPEHPILYYDGIDFLTKYKLMPL